MHEQHIDVTVIEDDPRLLEAIASVFREEGFEARAFTDPLAALAALIARPPRLVITDEEMPGLAGHELMERAREQLIERAPRFLLVTASNVPRSCLIGFDGVLYKPFRLDDLLAHARRLGLRRRRSGVQARVATDDDESSAAG